MMTFVQNPVRKILGGLFKVKSPIAVTQNPKFAVDTGNSITGVGSVITSNVPRISVTKGLPLVNSRRY